MIIAEKGVRKISNGIKLHRGSWKMTYNDIKIWKGSSNSCKKVGWGFRWMKLQCSKEWLNKLVVVYVATHHRRCPKIFFFTLKWHTHRNSDLSNNHITVLPPDVFSNLSRLATLIVSYNKLQCVQSRAFSGKWFMLIM